MLKFDTGVVEVTVNGAVPVATVEVNCVPVTMPVATTDEGVIAPSDNVIDGIVVGLATEPLIPLAVVTERVDTEPVEGVTQFKEPAVAPAVSTLPLLEVPVTGICKLPSPVG